MTDEEFDELLARAGAEVQRQHLSAPPDTGAGGSDDAYAERARHAEFGACAH